MMSISDIKSMEIKNYQIFILFGTSLLFIEKENIFFIFSFCLILFLLGMIFQKYIGGGDIKVFIILTIIFKQNILFVFLFSSSLALLYCIFNKKKKVPFIPFILISTLITIILIRK